MKQAFALLGIMTLVVSVGAFIAFERAEAPTINNDVIDESNNQTMSLTLASPAFADGGLIPAKYTCDGENVSPELHVSGIPDGTQSLVLVMDDPDIPESVKQARGIEKFDHWALYNISPDTTVIGEGAQMGSVGLNTRGESAYTGPCPPDKEHRYIFRLYALTGTLNFIQAPTLDDLEGAARGMTLASTTLIGRYDRSTQ